MGKRGGRRRADRGKESMADAERAQLNRNLRDASAAFLLDLRNGQWNVPVTPQLLVRGLSRHGGYSAAQRILFGRQEDPNWQRAALGTMTTREIADRFVALRDAHLPPRG